MDQTRFLECVETYGGDLARWPAELAALARVHSATAGGAAALAEAARLDAVLAQAPLQAPDLALQQRIQRSFAPGGSSRAGGLWGWLFPDLPRWAPAAAMAAAIVLGLGLSSLGVTPAGLGDSQTAALEEVEEAFSLTDEEDAL